MRLLDFCLIVAQLLTGHDALAARSVKNGEFGELSSSPFVVTPSTSNLVQGQSLTLVITPSNSYGGQNLLLSASLDGESVGVNQPTPQTWTLTVGPFNSVGSHDINLALSLENSEISRQYQTSIRSVNAKIIYLESRISNESDPQVRAVLRAELSAKQNLLGQLTGQLIQLRTNVGSQDFQFTVSPNTSGTGFPLVASISPNVGPLNGGTQIVITGSNFSAGSTVLIGGIPATNVVVVSATTITATSPVFSSLGSQNVEVDAPVSGGGSASSGILPSAFYVVAANTPSQSTPPVAVTTGSQTILLGRAVTIDGSQSYDWGGVALNYEWSVLAAPQGSVFQPGLTIPNASMYNFTPDVNGTYILQLIVQQAAGRTLSSAPSLAIVTVGGSPVPTSPAIQVAAGASATAQVAANDSSGVAESYSIQTAPQHGSAVVNSQGLVTYTAAVGYTGSDSIVVQVTNQYGLSGSVTITVSVTMVRKQ